MKALEISGQSFNRLTAISRAGIDAHGKVKWKFSCDCGSEVIATASLVVRGVTSSCGCLRKEIARVNGRLTHGPIKHGESKTPEYMVWKTMRQRCVNKNSRDYPAYGGRGVSVCDRWDLFENFIADMGPRPTSDHSIDRIDCNGNYEPANCKWSDDFEQARNRRQRGTGEYAAMNKENNNGI